MNKNFSGILIKLGAVLLISIFLTSCSGSTSVTPQPPLKAAIIDQLGELYPDPQFIREITAELEKLGFAITVIPADRITVDLYRTLPSYEFKLIIFRVHSTVVLGSEPYSGKTYLFTSEPYSQSKYFSQQLADQVLPAKVDDNSPNYFAVWADFIASYTTGRFNKSVIIVMGCNSLYSTDVADAFVTRGALIYTGWTASVKLDFVDDFTIALVHNLCNSNTIKDALFQTANEKGTDPAFGAVFSYYPAENGNYSLQSLK